MSSISVLKVTKRKESTLTSHCVNLRSKNLRFCPYTDIYGSKKTFPITYMNPF